MAKKKRPVTKHKRRQGPRWDQILKKCRFPLLLTGIALIPRLLALLGMVDSPLFYQPAIDSKAYHDLAVGIASGDFIGHSTFWQAPLYPYFLGIIYWLFGVKILIAKLIQILLGAVNCYLIFRVADNVFTRRTAWLAYGISILFGPFIFFETQLLAPVLLNLLMLLALLVLLSYSKAPSLLKLIGAGVLIGLAQIGHGLVIAFLPALVIWLALIHRRRGESYGVAARATLYLLLGFIPVILTVTTRNYAVDGELVLVSSNFGANFYLGNHPNYDSTTAIRPGLEWDEFIQESVVAGSVTASERSGYYTDKALSNIVGDPLRFAGLIAKKAHLLAAGEEIKRNLDIYHFKHESVLLDLLIWRAVVAFPSGLILPFAISWLILFLAGMVGKERRQDKWLLWLFLISQAVAILLFFVSSRYRLVMMPVVIILAAAAFWNLVERLRSGRLTAITILLAPVLLLLVYCNLPRWHPTAKDKAENLFYEGLARTGLGECEKAIPLYQQALELNPGYSMARFNLANCQLRQGKDSLAVANLDEIVVANPNSFVAPLIVGRAFMDMGRQQRAEELFKAVLERNQNSAEARINLGQLYRMQGDTTRALWQLRKALIADPGSYKAENAIGAVYLDQGMLSQAADHFRRSYELNPSYASGLNNLATISARFNRIDEAERYISRAIKLDPDDVSIVLNQAAVLLQKGKPGEALEYLDRAVELAPKMPQAHYYRGITLLNMRRTQDAISEFRKTLQLNPNFAPARQELQRLGVSR